MIKPVRLFTDTILHKPCIPVTDFNVADAEAAHMLQTMMEYKGIGLAANQIGLNMQLAVLSLENKTKQIIIVNPKILNQSKELSTLEEGCLSAPGMVVRVQRPIWVEIEYQLLNGEKKQERFEGFDARIVQHELGHIFGRTIVDHLIKPFL